MNATVLNPVCPTREGKPEAETTSYAFPVQWPCPGDALHHWTRDREHMPKPITPMYQSFAALTASEGRAPTVEPYAESIIGRDDRIINGYDFTRLIAFTGTEEEMAQRIRRHRQVVGAVSARLQEVWEQDWRPELESIWAFWANFDLENASDAELAAHLESTIEKATRMWEIHYWMGPPMWFAIDEFVTYYCDLFPQKTALDAHRLLQGFESKTAQINRCLWELGQTARQEARGCQCLVRVSNRASPGRAACLGRGAEIPGRAGTFPQGIRPTQRVVGLGLPLLGRRPFARAGHPPPVPGAARPRVQPGAGPGRRRPRRGHHRSPPGAAKLPTLHGLPLRAVTALGTNRPAAH